MTASTRRRLLATLISTLLAATAAIGSGVVLAAPREARVSFHDTRGMHVVEAKRLDPRQWNVKVLSPALGRPVDIRILLPNGYDPTASRRYPVLYLFHGTSGGASDWVV